MKHFLLVPCLLLFFQVAARQALSGDSIGIITQQLANNNLFESEYVGFAGSASRQFALMKTLKRVAGQQELFLLTYHKHSAVRIYAFIALHQQNKQMAGKAYQQLSKDQTTIPTLNGCIGGQSTVAEIVQHYYKSINNK